MKHLLFIGICGLIFLIPKSLNEISNETREPASVARRPSSNAKSIHVVSTDPTFPVNELKDDGYQIVSGETGDDEPTPEARDEIFRKVGAWPYAKKLDQLDRGFLYLRAREYSGAQFAKTYPMLASATRARLQEFAKRGGWVP